MSKLRELRCNERRSERADTYQILVERGWIRRGIQLDVTVYRMQYTHLRGRIVLQRGDEPICTSIL